MDRKKTYDKLKENTVYVDRHCTEAFKVGDFLLDIVKTTEPLGV